MFENKNTTYEYVYSCNARLFKKKVFHGKGSPISNSLLDQTVEYRPHETVVLTDKEIKQIL